MRRNREFAGYRRGFSNEEVDSLSDDSCRVSVAPSAFRVNAGAEGRYRRWRQFPHRRAERGRKRLVVWRQRCRPARRWHLGQEQHPELAVGAVRRRFSRGRVVPHSCRAGRWRGMGMGREWPRPTRGRDDNEPADAGAGEGPIGCHRISDRSGRGCRRGATLARPQSERNGLGMGIQLFRSTRERHL